MQDERALSDRIMMVRCCLGGRTGLWWSDGKRQDVRSLMGRMAATQTPLFREHGWAQSSRTTSLSTQPPSVNRTPVPPPNASDVFYTMSTTFDPRAPSALDYDLLEILFHRSVSDPALHHHLSTFDFRIVGSFDVADFRMLLHSATLRMQILASSSNISTAQHQPMTAAEQAAWAERHLPSPIVHLLAMRAQEDPVFHGLAAAVLQQGVTREQAIVFMMTVDHFISGMVGEGRGPVLVESTMARAVRMVAGKGGVTGLVGGCILREGMVRVAAVGGVWTLRDVRYMSISKI